MCTRIKEKILSTLIVINRSGPIAIPNGDTLESPREDINRRRL